MNSKGKILPTFNFIFVACICFISVIYSISATFIQEKVISKADTFYSSDIYLNEKELENEIIKGMNLYTKSLSKIQDGSKSYVPLDYLVQKEFIDKHQVFNSLDNCNGYGFYYYNNKLEIKAYVKCKDYKTSGFDESKLR
ncbi:MAG: hypothetical protein ACK5HL_02695 [Bacilli bacterium]